MDSKEVELVIEAVKGNRDSFEELVRLTSRVLYARIYMEMGDRHQAEDLVQETYMKAYKIMDQLNDPKGFRSWLYAIGQTVVIDYLRYASRKKRAGKHVHPDVLDHTSSSAEAPSAQAAQSESRQKALAVLRSLPEEYREPLMLRYLAGADYDSISRQLGLSNGSLRGMLNRGIAKLRQELQPEIEQYIH